MKITQILESKTISKVPATTPRNFVAKNAKTGGAGAHKDKKKAVKQGDTKHKKKEMELAEGHRIVPGIDKERYQERPGLEGPFHAKNGKVVYYDPREGKYYDPDSDFYIDHDDWAAMNEESSNIIQQVATKIGDTLATALPQEYRPFDNQTAANNTAKYKQAQTKEDYDGEYDDETGMASNQLQTIQRCAKEMEDNLIDGENLPEWVQSKITLAKEHLVTAFDYILSQHQNGEVEEGMYRRPGSPSAYDRDYASSVSGMGKRDSLAYQLDGGANDERHDLDDKYQAPQDTPVLQGYYFYDVPAGKEQEAASYGIKQTKSGKWAKAKYNTSGRSFGMQKDMADKAFGPGKFWAPK